MADVRAHSGVPVAAQFGGLETPTMCAPLVVNSTTGYIYSLTAAGAVVAAGAAGTVTSVAQTFTGGIISVAGSPITTSGTLALTVAGTSGGVPYFSSGTAWASSGALAANAIVLGGGAGAAPATTTTGTGVVTALGVAVGSAGAFVVNGGALGTPSSGTATNLTGTAAGLSIGGNAATVTTNANLTGAIVTSTGNATAVNMSPIANTLSGDVNLNNTANFFDGPSIAQGSTGTWFVSGYVTVYDTTGSANMQFKLYDGTTTIASGYEATHGTNSPITVHLSGYIASPAGNLRIAVKDITNTTGVIAANLSGLAKDSVITAIRIA